MSTSAASMCQHIIIRSSPMTICICMPITLEPSMFLLEPGRWPPRREHTAKSSSVSAHRPNWSSCSGTDTNSLSPGAKTPAHLSRSTQPRETRMEMVHRRLRCFPASMAPLVVRPPVCLRVGTAAVCIHHLTHHIRLSPVLPPMPNTETLRA
jgi:hypothetical protein